MGYHVGTQGTSQGRYVDARILDLSLGTVAAAATTTGPAVEMDARRQVTLRLGAGTISSADTLDVKIQGSDDNVTWFDIVAFAQQTDASFAAQLKTFVAPRYIRAVSVVAGSAIAITSTLKGEAI